MSDNGHKYVAQVNFKTLTENVHKLVEKTLENYDFKDSGNMIVTLMNKVLPTKSPESLTVVKPIIEKIVKQKKFNPNIKDDSSFGSNSVAWLGELGADFLEKCIKSMQTKPDVNLEDKNGMTALQWSSDYNDDKVVKVLVENGGNVNSASSEKVKITFPVAV